MDKKEFCKIYLISEFLNYIRNKNYSENTIISYINDLLNTKTNKENNKVVKTISLFKRSSRYN